MAPWLSLCLAAGLAGFAAGERIASGPSLSDAMGVQQTRTERGLSVQRGLAVHGHTNLGSLTVFSAGAAEEDGKCHDVKEKIKRLADGELKKGKDDSDAGEESAEGGRDETAAATFLGDVDEGSGKQLLQEAEAVLSKADLSDALEQGEVITMDDSNVLVECTTGQSTRLMEQTQTDDGKPVVQGDMVYDNEDEAQAALLQIEQGSRWAGEPWTDGKIRWCYAPGVNDTTKSAWQAALKHISSQVKCVSFEDVGTESLRNCKGESPAVVVRDDESGCWSEVGMKVKRRGRAQQLNLGLGCATLGIATHELLHAIGFHHEQSREDRDKYVKINWKNIKEGMEHNFDIATGSSTFVAYDTLSLMHYGANDFAIDRKENTIEGMDSRMTKFMGQRDGMSEGDVYLLAKMYKCKGRPNWRSDYRRDALLVPRAPQRPASTEGKMRIWVMLAEDVPMRDDGKLPNPVFMLQHGSLTMETKQEYHNQNPIWNTVWVFDYDPKRSLRFKVFHERPQSLPVLFGTARIEATDTEKLQECSKECVIKLRGDKGTIKVGLCISVCTADGCGCKRRKLG